ncbi:MAG: sugar phosphate isomerase/epimerase [Oscillospiraceae bacterium]|nr:sugar phosphate isomerase/epimerase [Oscillospiraceae bacterium]
MIDIGCCGTTNTYLAIRDMGYDYIELSGRQIMSLSDEEFSDFLQLYKDTGFPCRGFNDYCGAQTPIVGEGSGSDAVRAYAEKICRRGAALGIKTIGIGAPSARTLPEGYPMEQADKEMADFLKMICPIAAEYGITILLEAVHAYMCNYLTLTPETAKMVQKLALPNLAMVLDYYHAMVMGEDLHGLSQFIPLVRHLHFSTDLENHARGYLRDEDIPLLSQLLSEAAAAGYAGGISIEAAADKLEADGEACCRRMKKAAENIA